MKKLLTIVMLLCKFAFVHGQVTPQDLISPVGDSFENSLYQLDWSIGELSIETYSDTINILTQGFHQGNYSITVVEQVKDLECEINVFPNPATDLITIKLSNNSYNSLSYNLVDINGKILIVDHLASNQNQIDIKTLTVGSYFFNIISNGKSLKTFKIIKSN